MKHANLAKSIGEKIRLSRKAARFSRRALAEKADVSMRYLNDLEKGEANVSIGVLARVAAALSLNMPKLFEEAGMTGAAPGEAAAPIHPHLARLIATMSAAEQEAGAKQLERLLAESRGQALNIALIGLRGAGKSTIGRKLAERLGQPFISITTEIAARAGMDVTDLFNLGGAEAYRMMEIEVTRELAERKGRFVVETAGGITGNSEAFEIILSRFRTIWLKATPHDHLARVAGQGDLRPMSGHPMALEHLKGLLAERAPLYGRAEIVIETSGKSIEHCLLEIELRLSRPAEIRPA